MIMLAREGPVTVTGEPSIEIEVPKWYDVFVFSIRAEMRIPLTLRSFMPVSNDSSEGLSIIKVSEGAIDGP